MGTWQLQEAKARFSEVVKKAAKEGSQRITVRGEPASVAVSENEFKRLGRRKPRVRWLACKSLRRRAPRQIIWVVVMLIILASPVFGQSVPPSPEPLYPIFENNRWGLINPAGKVVLQPRFEMVGRYGWQEAGPWPKRHLPTSVGAAIEITSAVEPAVTDPVIPIRFDGKAGFATRGGQVLVLGRYEEIGFRFAEGRIWVRSGGRYGFADERGEHIVASQFDLVWSFERGFSFVKVNNRWGVIDRDGRVVAPPTWDDVDVFPGDEWVRVRMGDQWGVIDRSGAAIIPIRFENVSRPVGPLIFAVDSGRSVYVRPGGAIALELTCPKGLFRTPKAEGYPFFEKSAIVKCGGRYGLIDTHGNFLLEPTLDHIQPFYEGRAVVRTDGETGVIDENGRFVVAPGGLRIFTFFSRGVALFASKVGPKYGILDRDGRVVAEMSLEFIGSCGEGLCVAHSGGKWGYIDMAGRWVIEPRFSRRPNPFRGLLATVEQPIGKNMKEVAYINRAGSVVYRMQFTGFINH